MKICHSCNKELSIGRSIGRRDVCSSCGADLYCCLNCKFYDPSVSKQCREPATELVKEKPKANFCDYFVFVEARVAGAPVTAAEQARRAFGDLFKK